MMIWTLDTVVAAALLAGAKCSNYTIREEADGRARREPLDRRSMFRPQAGAWVGLPVPRAV